MDCLKSPVTVNQDHPECAAVTHQRYQSALVSGSPRIIEKCLASDRIVIDTVVSKYCNHTPLHRQSVILKRHISRATLGGRVLKVGELLIPMVAAMRRELVSGTCIQADETPVDVQMHEGRGKNVQPGG